MKLNFERERVVPCTDQLPTSGEVVTTDVHSAENSGIVPSPIDTLKKTVAELTQKLKEYLQQNWKITACAEILVVINGIELPAFLNCLTLNNQVIIVISDVLEKGTERMQFRSWGEKKWLVSSLEIPVINLNVDKMSVTDYVGDIREAEPLDSVIFSKAYEVGSTITFNTITELTTVEALEAFLHMRQAITSYEKQQVQFFIPLVSNSEIKAVACYVPQGLLVASFEGASVMKARAEDLLFGAIARILSEIIKCDRRLSHNSSLREESFLLEPQLKSLSREEAGVPEEKHEDTQFLLATFHWLTSLLHTEEPAQDVAQTKYKEVVLNRGTLDVIIQKIITILKDSSQPIPESEPITEPTQIKAPEAKKEPTFITKVFEKKQLADAITNLELEGVAAKKVSIRVQERKSPEYYGYDQKDAITVRFKIKARKNNKSFSEEKLKKIKAFNPTKDENDGQYIWKFAGLPSTEELTDTGVDSVEVEEVEIIWTVKDVTAQHELSVTTSATNIEIAGQPGLNVSLTTDKNSVNVHVQKMGQLNLTGGDIEKLEVSGSAQVASQVVCHNHCTTVDAQRLDTLELRQGIRDLKAREVKNIKAAKMNGLLDVKGAALDISHFSGSSEYIAQITYLTATGKVRFIEYRAMIMAQNRVPSERRTALIMTS